MERQKQAYVYALTAVLMWSTVAAAFKITLRYLDYLHLLLFSSCTACVILFVVLVSQKKLPLLKSCSGRDFLYSAFLGFLNPYLYYVILFKAYSLLPAQEAQPLNYTWPVVLVLLSIPLLKQRITLRSVAAGAPTPPPTP